MASILLKLHGIKIEFESNSSTINNYWQQTLAPFPTGTGKASLKIRLDLARSIPKVPEREPDFRQGDLLAYYIEGPVVIAHFPRFGQFAAHGAVTSLGYPVAFHADRRQAGTG